MLMGLLIYDLHPKQKMKKVLDNDNILMYNIIHSWFATNYHFGVGGSAPKLLTTKKERNK